MKNQCPECNSDGSLIYEVEAVVQADIRDGKIKSSSDTVNHIFRETGRVICNSCGMTNEDSEKIERYFKNLKIER